MIALTYLLSKMSFVVRNDPPLYSMDDIYAEQSLQQTLLYYFFFLTYKNEKIKLMTNV